MDPESSPYIFGDPELDRQRLETQSRLLARYVRDHAQAFVAPPVERILDVGCAAGQLSFVLQDALGGAHLTGIDRDAEALARARTEAAATDSPATFIEGDVQEALPPGPYDLVFMSLLLLHVRAPAQVLAHAYAVLRPGGTLWVIDNVGINPSYDSPSATELFNLLWTTLARIGGHPDILAELPALCADLGFVDYTRRETHQDHPTMPTTPAERTQLSAAGLGAIYNAKPLIAQVMRVPMDRLNQLFVEMTNEMMLGTWTEVPPIFGVVTARKPTEGTD